MDLSPKVEDGEIMSHNVVSEASNEGDFNPFVSLAPLADGVHLLDLVPRLLMLILHVEDLLLHEFNYSLVSSFSDDSQKEDALGEALGEPNFQLVLFEGEYVNENVDSLIPLQILPPQLSTNSTSDWVLNKVEELQACLGLFYDGFEEQFKALVAIEACCSLSLK